MGDLKEIERAARSKKGIEEVLKKFDWRGFEEIVAEIFIANGFHVKNGVRFKTRKRYEIDLVAIKSEYCLCVDCKKWGGGRYKLTALREAIKRQIERTEEFKKVSMHSLEGKLKFYPLIVTLMEEEIKVEHNVFVIPVWKLNKFLINLEAYL